MECCWCGGSGKDARNHFCEHCNKGVVTDPPYGPMRYLLPEDKILTTEQTSGINWVPVHHLERIRFIADTICGVLGAKFKLSDEDVHMFQGYWFDNYRNETIGDVMQRIAMYIKDRMKNETVR